MHGPSLSCSQAFGLSLWGYVKDQVYSLGVIMLEALKARTTVATADITKDMLQLVCQQADLRWGVCRARDDTHCKVFRI
jgi:hypothetical protein